MKFKKLLLFGLVTIGINFISAQQLKIKNNVAYINGEAYLKIDPLQNANEYEIQNLKGEPLIFANCIRDYTQLSFLGLDTKIELQRSRRNVIKMLYNNKVINKDGEIIEDSLKSVYERYGDFLSRAFYTTDSGS